MTVVSNVSMALVAIVRALGGSPFAGSAEMTDSRLTVAFGAATAITAGYGDAARPSPNTHAVAICLNILVDLFKGSLLLATYR